MKTSYIKQLQENIGQSMKGKMAGFGGWLDGKVTKIDDEGNLEMQFVVREDMLNPMGNIHGGAVAAIVDEILGFQIFLQSAEDAAYVSMTMNVDFLRGAKGGETITAIPKVIRIGKKTANVTCQLLDSQGKVVAQGTSNFMRVI